MRTDPRIDPVPRYLTRRQREIVVMMAAGLTDRQIAERLGIAFRTVTTHNQAIYKKLGATNRAAAVARYYRGGV